MSNDETPRDDLAELMRRRALTEDAARPEAVERRHARDGRTARENIGDLVDPGSFVEYGRFAIAAQRFRRDVDDLIRRTPADEMVAGTARIDGSPCAVLSYDYTVLAGTQGALGHRKKDRYHARLAKNYVTWVRRYLAPPLPPAHSPDGLAGKPIARIIGGIKQLPRSLRTSCWRSNLACLSVC